MRKWWLIFSQSATVSLGILLAISIIRPDWIPFRNNTPSTQNGTITINEISEHSAGVSKNATAPFSYHTAVNHALPAVVNVFSSKKVAQHPFMEDPFFRRFFGERPDNNENESRSSSLGSGVIVSSEGYILTNHHVVESADEIEVALANGRHLKAKIVGTDPETDLAVLKVNEKNLPVIVFGQSDQAKVGDVVLAIGNPFGVGQTVTMGIVSALGRSHLGINTFENFIQTDAAINPGNSGGALVDAQGHLIGINSAIYSRTGGSLGIGFAIPVSLAKQVMEQIIKNGYVVRGWIGIEAHDLTPDIAKTFNLKRDKGVLISGVLRGGPAEQAGIHAGDVLVSINDQEIKDSSNMLNLIAGLSPGQKAKLSVERDTGISDFNVVIGTRPKPRPQSATERSNPLLPLPR